MKKKVNIITTIVIILIIVIFFDKIINFIANIEWYREVGYLKVYFTKIIATLKLMIPVFIISYLGIWLYYKSLRKSIEKVSNISNMSIENKRLEKRIFTITNIIVSFTISYIFSISYWYRILQFTNATKFNVKDPIFGLDVSFFVFKLPLIESIYKVVMSLLVILVILTLIIYFIMNAKDKIFSERTEAKGFKNKIFMKSGLTIFAGKQLAIISSLIILCLSLGYFIKAWNLVYSPRGVAYGASYTDVMVTLNFYRVIIVVSIITSIIIFINVLKTNIKPILISISVLIGIIILEGVVAAAVQNFRVKPNERILENPYIKYNIDYTRKAFNIENIAEKDFNIKDNLTKQDILNNKGTVDNIKVNSYKQVLEFYNQVQVIRYYYDFNGIDVDRYNINDKLTQVFVSPREIDLDTLEGNANTWQNKHLNYTHGYGIVMNKVNSVTSEGQPSFVIKDIPSDNSTGLKLENPRIYFGEKTNEYAVVNTVSGEFDYPKSGDENEVNNYNGTAGIKMSVANKILFAIREKNVNFLLSKEIKSNSKILINRNIMDRVKKIAPFLTYDKDPYIVLNDGKLYWIIDAFTISDRYPFSQPDKSGVNYIRNSIKIIVDAESGNTNFYIIDKNDPIAQSYLKIFPSLFKDYDSIPEGMIEHFRYPEDLFNMQCSILGKYHVTDEDVFYKGEDLWEISRKQGEPEDHEDLSEPAYVVMKLPEEKKEEMILLEYFNMRNRSNMAALFGARMDKDNYGKLVLYKLPSKKTIFSPYLFKQKLIQDASISKELSLWNKGGDSKVQYGDTVIVPINNSLLYVEPIYLRAEGKNSIPEMKRVIVSYSDKLVIAENIEEALKKLFDEDKKKPQIEKNQTNTTLDVNSNPKIKQAKELYDKALESQKDGDWVKYGENINKLGEILNELNKE